MDVIIIGKGPAGISTALYTQRANLKTLVIGTNDSVLLKTDKIENYYGFEHPITGRKLFEEGVEQARRLGVNIHDEEVIAIEKEDDFHVITTNNKYKAKSVLIATGQKQKPLKIKGIQEFEGKGVSYCTTCDGFFYRGLKVGILGWKDYAVHEAKEMEAFTNNITFYTNGEKLEVTNENLEWLRKYNVLEKKIVELSGDEFIQKIVFEDGTDEDLDGLFIANESASSVDFARKLGVMVEGNAIVVDREQKTNLEGLFAAGDCTGGFKQIATAVGQGATAAKSIIEYVRKKR